MSFERLPPWIVRREHWATWPAKGPALSASTVIVAIIAIPLIITFSTTLLPKNLLRSSSTLAAMALTTLAVAALALRRRAGETLTLRQRIQGIWASLAPGTTDDALRAGVKFYLLLILVMPVVTLLNGILGDALGFKTGGSNLQSAPLQAITAAPSMGALLWAWVATGLLVPFVEEFVFRGMALSWAKTNAGWTVAVIGVSGIFALLHGAPGLWLPVFTLGVLFSLATVQARSCVAPMVSHALWNTTVLLLATLGNHG